MSDIVERWPHTKIYLEPRDCADPSTGPLWCQDDIGSEDENGHPIAWEPYIKEKEAADLITALRDENEKLTKRVEWFTHAIHTCHDECDRPLCKTTRERDALRAELERKDAALEVCDRVLHFDLRKMITWGPDYNQAVKDAADAARAALSPAQKEKTDDHA